jgi:hypothetical protein
MATLATTTQEIKSLQRILFYTHAGKADEKYFRSQLARWITTHPTKRPTWHQLLDRFIFARNNDPKKLKYCAYSRDAQALKPTKSFIRWADLAAQEIAQVLQQIHA